MNNTHVLKTEIWVPAPIEEVWDYFQNIQNLAKLTPDWYGAKVSYAEPLDSDKGPLVRLQMSPLGVGIGGEWLSRLSDITSEGEKRSFVDTQEKGFFAHWKHWHGFESADNGTWIKDRVEYSLPFGAAGRLLNSTLVRSMLGRLFAFRQKKLRTVFSR